VDRLRTGLRPEAVVRPDPSRPATRVKRERGRQARPTRSRDSQPACATSSAQRER
jgi:hypothetical protein